MKRWGRRIALILFAILILIPVLMVVITSFKTNMDFARNILGFPDPVTWKNYLTLFSAKMLVFFKNSVVVTFFTVTLIIFLSSMISYAIVRIGGWKGNVLYGLFILGMLIPSQVNMIPLYGLVSNMEMISDGISWIPDIHIRNSLSGLIVIQTSVLLSIAVFIITGFMQTIPRELLEAAAVDGATEWFMYSRIAFPISLPSIAASTIFLSVIVWNDLLYPLLFVTKDEFKTLPLALLQFQGQYETNFPTLFAGVVIASLPMVLAYLFLQRWFVEGMTAGSIKG